MTNSTPKHRKDLKWYVDDCGSVFSSHVNLLKTFKGSNAGKFEDVTKSEDTKSLAFGPTTNDLLLDKKNAKKLIWNLNKKHDETTFVVVAKLSQLETFSSRSTLLSVLSPTHANIKYFEIYIENYEGDEFVEGMSFRDRPKVYRLGIAYTTEGKLKTIKVPLNNNFQLRKWFKLVIRFVEGSKMQVYMNCKNENERVLTKMDKIPSFAEVRIAQSVQEDIWTSDKIVTSRFIGEMKTSKLLFGKIAFIKHDPCGTQSSEILIEGGNGKIQKNVDDFRMLFSMETLFGKEAAGCYFKSNRYEDGQNWKANPCTSCKCEKGDVTCEKIDCFKKDVKDDI
eukprot:gene7327-8145_t